jgi:thiol-disulfide isomerase/thioredoxin
MIHRIDISSYLYILMMVFMFICGTSFSQDFITSSNFNKKIAKDIVVVEFWAGWNASNEFKELIKLKDCVVYRVDISAHMDIQMDYDIAAIPTVVIFDNGEEKERFKPNVMFQLDADKKTIQNSVDTLTLNKFQ